MTQIRHMELITHEPSITGKGREYHDVFLSYIELVLKYEHSEVPVDEEFSEKDKKDLFVLYQHLRSNFFETLYVDRREREQLERWDQIRKMPSILTGQVGSGKTTLLLRLYRDMFEDEGIIAFYVDLPKKFAELNDIISQDDRFLYRDRVCLVLSRQVEAECRKVFPNFDWEFQLYRVQNSTTYNGLANTIRANENPQSEEEWKIALKEPVYKEWIVKNEMALEENENYTETLQLLIEFLNLKKPEKSIVFIVDNLDKYSARLQRQVFSKSLDFSRLDSVKFFLAFRIYNLKKAVRIEGEFGEPYHVENIDMTLPKGLVPTPLSVDKDTVREFLSKRLNLVKEMGVDVVTREKFGELFGKTLGMNYDQFMGKFWELFDKAIVGTESGEIIGKYRNWCNGSLRNLSIHVFRYISSLIVGEDPYYSIKSILSSYNSRPNRRVLRSFIYKKMMCGNSALYSREHSPGINVFRSLNRANEGPFDIFFPEHKLICYLERQDRVVSYGEVCEDFIELGISQKKVFEALIRLNSARDRDQLGFVQIDRNEDHLKANMSPETPILLLPAGRFFINTLSTSCEYLFWCAMDTSLDYVFEEFIGAPTGYTKRKYIELMTDETKSLIAVEFMRRSLIPKFIQEIKSIKKEGQRPDPTMTMEHFNEKFGDINEHWGIEILSSMHGFITSRIPMASLGSLRSDLDECYDKLAEVLDLKEEK